MLTQIQDLYNKLKENKIALGAVIAIAAFGGYKLYKKFRKSGLKGR